MRRGGGREGGKGVRGRGEVVKAGEGMGCGGGRRLSWGGREEKGRGVGVERKGVSEKVGEVNERGGMGPRALG